MLLFIGLGVIVVSVIALFVLSVQEKNQNTKGTKPSSSSKGKQVGAESPLGKNQKSVPLMKDLFEGQSRIAADEIAQESTSQKPAEPPTSFSEKPEPPAWPPEPPPSPTEDEIPVPPTPTKEPELAETPDSEEEIPEEISDEVTEEALEEEPQQSQPVSPVSEMDTAAKKSVISKRIVAFLLDQFLVVMPLGFVLHMFIPSQSWLVGSAYLLFRDCFNGRSIGKLIMSLQAVGPEGQKITFVQGILRNITMVIPILPIIEFFVLLSNKDAQRLGDMFAKTSVLDLKPRDAHSEKVAHSVAPIGVSGWAIAAGYAGLFALIIIPAPLALILGIIALVDLKMNPGKRGKGRVALALITGIVGTGILLFYFLVIAPSM